VISNYAFSELPSHLQRTYIKKVLSNSKRGYLTMNSGRGSSRDEGKLSIDELRELLPSFEIHEEKPQTASNNYALPKEIVDTVLPKETEVETDR
jgi:hypothetical protein